MSGDSQEYRHPGWSPRCNPGRRLLLLDIEVARLERAGEVDGAVADWLESVNEEFCDSALGWDAARAVHRGCARSATAADLLILGLYTRFGQEQLWTLPVALGAGATPGDCLALGVHGRNCRGEDLPMLADDVLEDRLRAAGELLQFRTTAWLVGYGKLLRTELRRRRYGA